MEIAYNQPGADRTSDQENVDRAEPPRRPLITDITGQPIGQGIPPQIIENIGRDCLDPVEQHMLHQLRHTVGGTPPQNQQADRRENQVLRYSDTSSDDDDLPPRYGDRPRERRRKKTKQRPIISLNQAPPIGVFFGKARRGMDKVSRCHHNPFPSTHQTDRTATQQFSLYIDGTAYQFRSTLPPETKKSFPELLKAFDQKYSDEVNQSYWQQQYKQLKYASFEKETPEDFAVKIQTIVNKGWPDYIRPSGENSSKGTKHEPSTCGTSFGRTCPQTYRRRCSLSLEIMRYH